MGTTTNQEIAQDIAAQLASEPLSAKQRFDAAMDQLHDVTRDELFANDDDLPDALLGLQPKERDLFVIGLLYGQVCNGGFLQWHDNGYSKTLGLVQHALRALGGPAADEVLSLLVEVMPLIEDAEHASAEGDEDHYEEICDQVDALDSRFYEGIDARLISAIAERWLGDGSGLNMMLAERAPALPERAAIDGTYELDGEPVPCTLEELVRENELTGTEALALGALKVGQSYEFGGGAWASRILRRVA